MKKVIILIIAIAVIVGGVYLYRELNNIGPDSIISRPVACTMEAKICPDGSAVGRTGPKCEFAACPGEVLPLR